jgi:glycosyltransferase involved in cell wall biosynthesis
MQGDVAVAGLARARRSAGSLKGRTRVRRVLMVDHTAALGGGEIALLNLVAHLDRSRYEPVVLLFADGPLVQLLRNKGVEVHIRPLHPSVGGSRKDSLGTGSLLKFATMGRSLAFCGALAGLMRRLSADLVHTNSLKADLIGGLSARLAGIPLLWHVRDRIADDYLPRAVVRAFRVAGRLIPDRLVANSYATLATLTGAAEPAVNEPDVDRRQGSNQRRCVVHDGTSLPAHVREIAGAPLVGLVGRISPWKGQDVFLRAAAEVAARFPEARFQVIGAALFAEQEYERQVRQLAADLNVPVEFTGFRSDVGNLIEQLTVLVHASTSGEPFGQVVIEGMAAGKPVVATAGGGVLEIVDHGMTGLLVPMKDHSAMAGAISQLLADPAHATAMGQRGRQRVLKHFTIEQTADRMQGVYDSMLGAASHRLGAEPRQASY